VVEGKGRGECVVVEQAVSCIINLYAFFFLFHIPSLRHGKNYKVVVGQLVITKN
jgi:hypothetical protein